MLSYATLYQRFKQRIYVMLNYVLIQETGYLKQLPLDGVISLIARNMSNMDDMFPKGKSLIAPSLSPRHYEFYRTSTVPFLQSETTLV